MQKGKHFCLFGIMQMSNFKKDFNDLVDRVRGGHMQHWLYSDNMRKSLTGSQLWAKFYQTARGYYIPHDEKHLIQNRAHRLVKNSKADTVVDFGVGSKAFADKVKHIIKSLKNAKLYSGIDISKDMLQQVHSTVTKLLPDLKIETQHVDFHGEKVILGGERRLGLILGCSITNQNMMEGGGFPHDDIVKNFKDFIKHLENGNELLVTYDANTNGNKAIAAYSNKFWSEHVTGLMYDAQKKLKKAGDFSASDWSHQAIWDEHAKVIHQCVVANRAQTMETKDRTYRFKQGERFVAVNNFKYTPNRFNDICEDAGYRIGQRSSKNTIQLQHLNI